MTAVLRDVVESDLEVSFEHQRDPEADEMAVFPARDREAFDAHWRRLLLGYWSRRWSSPPKSDTR